MVLVEVVLVLLLLLVVVLVVLVVVVGVVGVVVVEHVSFPLHMLRLEDDGIPFDEKVGYANMRQLKQSEMQILKVE